MARHLPHLAPARPVVHLSTPSGWLNDPNGLSYVDGRWHAFYQHDPATDTHGTMHWGHATSDDLLHWHHHEIAIAPNELGDVFSGSVVIDDHDTAGFGAGALVAIFTHHLPGRERQSLAYSTDRGATWIEYGHNPVLESDEPDFRDPKVFWCDLGSSPAWVMVLAVGREVHLYRSPNLRDWEFASAFVDSRPELQDWECPDLIRLDGDDHDRWLLIFGAVGAGPYGHSGTTGYVGTFDGTTFTPTGSPQPIDVGPDFYAAQSFSNSPSGVIIMGWMNSWLYSSSHPSDGWRGVLSMPRKLHFEPTTETVRSVPILDRSSGRRTFAGTEFHSTPTSALLIETARAELELDVVDASGESIAKLTIAETIVRLERLQPIAESHQQSYQAAIQPTGGHHRVIVDHGSIEVFAGDGHVAMSALLFPGTEWSVRTSAETEMTVLR